MTTDERREFKAWVCARHGERDIRWTDDGLPWYGTEGGVVTLKTERDAWDGCLRSERVAAAVAVAEATTPRARREALARYRKATGR